MSESPETVLDHDAVEAAVDKIAQDLADQVGKDLALIGIHRGGVPLSRRLASALEAKLGERVALGSVDIAFYRDDAATALPDPKIGPSEITFDLAGRDVVLVDDVLQTGRTVRAAIDALLDFGRPRRVWLAVLCDRGGHELPIAADFVGKRLEAPADARIEVRLTGPKNQVVLVL